MKTIMLLVVSFPIIAGEISVPVVPDYSNLEILRDISSHQRVDMPGTYMLGKEGEPELPFLPIRVALPAGMRATDVQLTDCEYDTLAGKYDIVPLHQIICGSSEPTVPPLPDEHLYSLDSFFPGNSIQEWASGILWGFPMCVCWLRPLQWNPETGELRVLRSAQLSVETEPDPDWRGVLTRTGWSEDKAEDLLRTVVANPGDVHSSGAAIVPAGDLEYGQYVIVTVPQYSDAMEELADWKTSKGVPTSIYTTDWIQNNYQGADLQQSVRTFLTDCITAGTDFLLLVGDNDVFQARFTWPSTIFCPLPTDLYYADNNDTQPGIDNWDSNMNGRWGEPADNVDWHPDLWVGRASVNSVEEAEIFVDKVLIYEHRQQAGNPASGWETSMGYTTGCLQQGGVCPCSDYAEIISEMVPDAWNETKCYESQGSNSTAITIDMINQGQGNVFHACHGGPTEMYTAYGDLFTVDDIMQLQNIADAGAVTIWNTVACYTGAFDTLTCCADAWLNAPDGGGFGVFNARPAMMTVNFPICEGFYQVYLEMGFPYLGIAHGMSLDLLSPPVSGGTFIQMNNLFGDPELPMWIDPHGQLLVEHPASVGSSGSFQVKVTDQSGSPVENARICLQQGDWKTGPVYEVGYTDQSGDASFSVEPQCPGEISITAWAHDYDTYSGTITAGYAFDPDEHVLFQVRSTPSSEPVLLLALETEASVDLSIYDVSGRMVTRSLSGEVSAGSYELPVQDLNSGIYFARLRTESFAAVRSFVVLR